MRVSARGAASSAGRSTRRPSSLACTTRRSPCSACSSASSAQALALYEHAGFVRYGLLPRAIKIDGRYHDKALMVKVL